MNSNNRNEKQQRPRGRLLLSWGYRLLVCLMLISVGSGLTYAWFTSNASVQTQKLQVKTGERDFKLEISRNKTDFRDEEVSLGLNQADLMPVSTADLATFIESEGAEAGDNGAEVFRDFRVTKSEAGYFHKTFYLRAVANEMPEGTTMKLYFDKTYESFFGKNGSKPIVNNAARLGIRFSENGTVVSALIFRISDEGSAANRANHTYIGGELAQGKVLTVSGAGQIVAVNDPAKSIADYALTESKIPETPLLEMTPGTIYQMDLYFYLEGCDEDCTTAICLSDTDMQIDLYGIEGGGE